MRRYILIIVIMVGCSFVIAGAKSAVESSSQAVYENHAYGYRVRLPPGVKYTHTAPPNPDHGLGMDLQGRGRLWVDASYTDSASTDEEVSLQTSGCHVEDRHATKLGGQPAIALRLSCPASSGSGAYQELLVLTVYREGDRSTVDYQVGLRVPDAEKFTEHRALFDKVLSGFQFEP